MKIHDHYPRAFIRSCSSSKQKTELLCSRTIAVRPFINALDVPPLITTHKVVKQEGEDAAQKCDAFIHHESILLSSLVFFFALITITCVCVCANANRIVPPPYDHHQRLVIGVWTDVPKALSIDENATVRNKANEIIYFGRNNFQFDLTELICMQFVLPNYRKQNPANNTTHLTQKTLASIPLNAL